MSVPCPCCGSPMQTPGLAALRHLSLPPYERKVLDVLINAYPRALSRREIADRVYADEPTGGPDTAENAISVYLGRMRATLAELGWNARWTKQAHGIVLCQVETRAAA